VTAAADTTRRQRYFWHTNDLGSPRCGQPNVVDVVIGESIDELHFRAKADEGLRLAGTYGYG
jgi:hypothetical protein